MKTKAAEPKVIRSSDGASYGIFDPKKIQPSDFIVGQAELERKPEPPLAPELPELAPTKERDLYTS